MSWEQGRIQSKAEGGSVDNWGADKFSEICDENKVAVYINFDPNY